MNTSHIRSSGNPLIKEYRRLSGSRKHRRAAGKLALEGPNLLKEALLAGHLPDMVFFTGAFLATGGADLIEKLPVEVARYSVTPTVFNAMARTETPREVAAVVHYREPDLRDLLRKELLLAVMVDRLQDPGNMGTILRTAAVSGVGAFFYTAGSVDPYSPKVLRSTAGAVFHLAPAVVHRPLELAAKLKEKGMQLVAASPRSPVRCWDMDFCKPTVLLIGNESGGLSPELEAAASAVVSIPQAGSPDSLNAAVAAGIILYEITRQRGQA